MKKIIAVISLSLFITACSNIGGTKISNLIDLTPKLEVESSKSIKITDGKKNPFTVKKTRRYNISRHTMIAKPAIAKKIVHSIDNKGYVQAFSLEKKKSLWTKDIANSRSRDFHHGGILYSNGKLYITNGSRFLITLDAISGDEIIRKEFPDIIRSKPVMATEKLLLVQTVSNQLLAYDVKNSKLVWIHEGGLETISSRNHTHPVVYNGYAIVSYSSGEVIYLDAKTGEEKWRYSLTNITDTGIPGLNPSVIITPPIIAGKYAYLATSNNQLIKMNLQKGTPVWVKKADDIQSMNLHQNILFVTNNARQIAALSTSDAKIIWVGNLISQKERANKKPKPTVFQKPFVSKSGKSFAVNVIAANGQLYQFTLDNGKLPQWPDIINIEKKATHYWLSCCTGELYLFTENSVRF